MSSTAENLSGIFPAGERATVLVIDDEDGIRRTLEGVLRDEGFDPLVAGDGEKGMAVLRDFRPSLVVLDIWMPGRDGLEVLKQIREIHQDLPVIMISGHATIATAMLATRLGAVDFIEKPLDLTNFIGAVRRALAVKISDKSGQDSAPADRVPLSEKEDQGFGRPKFDISRLERKVFASQPLKGRKIQQRTLARSAVLYGQGLHSGQKSGLSLEPLPPGSGIHFVGMAELNPVPAHVDYVESTGYATTLRLGQTQAGTIEHLMSALHAYRISNLLIKCNGEVPVMDGSAFEFCSLFDETGLEEQEGDWCEIKVDRVYRWGDEREWIMLEPAGEFSIDYTLAYPEPVGTQRLTFVPGSVEAFRREIAPARTFGFVKDIGALQKQGLALGGRFDNFVLIGPEGPVNTELRFADEMVRHKILDAMGDLYLLGRPICGKITACMTGHSDNISLLKLLREAMSTEGSL